MPKIQCLSPHVADLIAAGEVVERPASAAKELVENAIDAGAKHVTVELQNGGMTFLRVTDDGCGMASDDAETAFLRHATSTLRTAEDLEAIHTLGFRGEALAAISSVSRIDLMTKTADAPFGTSLHLEAGVVTERGEVGCPNGTTIIVRDLFYNTPARLKFMKRDAVEASALLSTVQRLALAHPETAIRVLRDGEEQLSTVGDGELLGAVRAVLGRQTAKDLIAVNSHWDKYTLTGFVSRPNATRGNRANQLFFVNGRNIRSKTMTAALEEAYRNRLMVGRYPTCVLCLTLPEHLVDVNVHPAKTEVKFINERDIFDCIRYGVQGALDRASGKAELHLPQQRHAAHEGDASEPQLRSPAPIASPAPKSAPKQTFFRTMSAEEYRTFAQVLKEAPRVQPSDAALESLAENAAARTAAPKTAPAATDSEAAVAVTPAEGASSESRSKPLTNSSNSFNAASVPSVGAEKAASDDLVGHDSPSEYGSPAAPDSPVGHDGMAAESPAPETDGPGTNTPKTTAPKTDEPTRASDTVGLPPEAADASEYRIVGEVLNTYIIVEQGRSVLLIDKHAAHERILFEKFRKQTEPVMSQLLLAPILWEPEREEAAILLENEALLRDCGYEVSDYGGGTLAIRQLPSEIDPDDAAALLGALASDLRAGKRVKPSELRDTMLHTIACKAAIKGGWHTDEREREALVREVMTRDDLKYCPHGRPICVELTAGQLERTFKRA